RRHTRFSRDWSSDVCSSDLWIFASDQVLLSIFPGLSEEALTVYQTSKGLVFIVVTTFVLYILSLRNTRMQDEILKQLNSTDRLRSEERRVGKEYRSRRSKQR